MPDILSHIDPFFVLCGVLVGGLVGFTGVGGGSLMTPTLILLFRVPPAVAVGTDLIYAAITNGSGSLVHGYNRTIDWKVVGRLAFGSVPMTALSIFLLYEIGAESKWGHEIVTKVLGLALFVTAILLFLRKPLLRWYERRVGEPDPKLVGRLTIATGAALGLLVTISSVGAGAIGVTALVMLYPKMPTQRIVGSDIAHAVPLTFLAGLGHSFLGTIDGLILVSLLCGSLPAIVVASIASARMSDTVVRVVLGLVLLAVVIRFWFL
ncbi:MAG TPA: sulfite exporter TauE/SafE family protein [Rhizomicrobium sp.]|nr:sulfite exporter TauE/SafE family protein [Rhizomicrobium sp.]